MKENQLMKWLEIEKTNYIYNITLNRPEVRNAFNPEMIKKITDTFKNIPDDVRVIVLRGKGSVFCSGADLEWMKSMVHFSLDENRKDSRELFQMFHTITNCLTPIISVVQGAAMGGALGILACSDVVIAESQTKFCFSEVKLGLVPAVISSFILSKTNTNLTSPWMISGKIFNVQIAQQMGLVHQFGSASHEIESQVNEWVQCFTDAAPGAVKDTKELVRQLVAFSQEKAATSPKNIEQLTTDLIAQRRVGAEGQEGLKSFLEKRKPAWRQGI